MDEAALKMERSKNQESGQFRSRDTLVRMEILAMLTASVGLIVLSLLKPAPLGQIADPHVTPVHVTAPWIFIWIQELLRHFPAFLGGVIIPLLFFMLITVLPFLSLGVTGESASPSKVRKMPLIILLAALLGISVISIIHILR
jgi:quinol-cytochrome oxidoreductase complex cytochrome b subunit